MFWGSIVLVGATLTGLAIAQEGFWTVNFYSSPDCSAQSLTSTHTGSDFYVEYPVSPKGQHLIVSKTGDGSNGSYQGAYACNDDQNIVCEFVNIGEGCVKGPAGGATRFTIF